MFVLIFWNPITERWDTGKQKPRNVFIRSATKNSSSPFQQWNRIQVFCDYERIQPIDNYIIQEYIREPFLIDGYKFGTVQH